ncbi:folate ECF transporter [Vagococcus elongatus]|uniref:Folate ECF transporter n=1 Tax=Vagococcus elongatus TaxID=180344 RepID=A0A430ALI3_9ENTE|nr:folate family ECF transporter S component [Vagococcus elongatus]RSU08936.1 folate ECF transporter [Vagococcus elongatus]
MLKKINIYSMTTISFLVALMVILSQVFGLETQFLKITFDFIPEVVMASLFGPFWTAVGASIADVIGNTLLGKAPFFIGFTLNAFIGGLIYGAFFYKKKVTLNKAFFCVLLNTLLISLCLTPIWLSIMYGVPLTDGKLWSLRIVKAAIMLPVQTGLIYFFGNAIPIKSLGRRFVSQ